VRRGGRLGLGPGAALLRRLRRAEAAEHVSALDHGLDAAQRSVAGPEARAAEAAHRLGRAARAAAGQQLGVAVDRQRDAAARVGDGQRVRQRAAAEDAGARELPEGLDARALGQRRLRLRRVGLGRASGRAGGRGRDKFCG